MSYNEAEDAVKQALDQAARELSKEDYQQLCEEIASDCDARVEAL